MEPKMSSASLFLGLLFVIEYQIFVSDLRLRYSYWIFVLDLRRHRCYWSEPIVIDIGDRLRRDDHWQAVDDRCASHRFVDRSFKLALSPSCAFLSPLLFSIAEQSPARTLRCLIEPLTYSHIGLLGPSSLYS